METQSPAASPSPTKPLRKVRSFVIRGKITKAQKRAYETLFPVYGIPFQESLLNFADVFGREAPVVMEIGFGMGEATAEIAAQHPEIDYLAVDVFKPGVGSLLRRIQERNLTNVRVMHWDAVEVLQHMIPDDSLHGIHIFFPDPWPKKRHHKRRLIQPPFVRLMAQKLAPGGYVHICTDWQDYAEQILEVLEAEPLLRNSAEGFAPRPEWRPLTKFEQQGLRDHRGVWDVHFIKPE